EGGLKPRLQKRTQEPTRIIGVWGTRKKTKKNLRTKAEACVTGGGAGFAKIAGAKILCAERFRGDIALTLRERLVTFPQDEKIFSNLLTDGEPALWRLSQRRFS